MSDMMHTTTLRSRRRRGGGGMRFRAALVLALCAAGAGWLVLGRDVDWPSRNRAARARALAAENAGDYGRARSGYEEALVSHPYDWEAHLRLANLLNHRLNVRSDALRHYLHALAYSPDRSIDAAARAEIAILHLLRNGELEDPADALEDMFLAAGAGAREEFLFRLDTGLLEGGDSYWSAWRERGRGKIAYSRIESDGRGLYDAMVELVFADGSSMSMHLRCPLRNIWRLGLSFP